MISFNNKKNKNQDEFDDENRHIERMFHWDYRNEWKYHHDQYE